MPCVEHSNLKQSWTCSTNKNNGIITWFCLICLQGCDDFTHNFLRKLGVRINNPENIPGDPYTDHRKKVCSLKPHSGQCLTSLFIFYLHFVWHFVLIIFQLVESMQPLRPYEKEDTLKQFLQFDRNVLRFFCLWDDCDRLVFVWDNWYIKFVVGCLWQQVSFCVGWLWQVSFVWDDCNRLVFCSSKALLDVKLKWWNCKFRSSGKGMNGIQVLCRVPGDEC